MTLKKKMHDFCTILLQFATKLKTHILLLNKNNVVAMRMRRLTNLTDLYGLYVNLFFAFVKDQKKKSFISFNCVSSVVVEIQ